MNGQPCVICGAKVINANPKTVTCSSFCTGAKKRGLTYSEAHELAAKEDSEIPNSDEGKFAVRRASFGTLETDDAGRRRPRHDH